MHHSRFLCGIEALRVRFSPQFAPKRIDGSGTVGPRFRIEGPKKPLRRGEKVA